MAMRPLQINKSITNQEALSVKKYLQEIGKTPLITIEEEMRLIPLIKEGNQAALEKLTMANLRFVVSVAKQYQNQGLSLSDLISEGNLGLMQAAQRFDETRGFKFISYAVWRIRQTILQAIAEQSRIIRLPGHKVSLNKKVGKEFSKLTQDFEREPSPEEIAESLDVEVEVIEGIMGVGSRHRSLDASFFEDEEHTLLDVLNSGANEPDHDLVYQESLKNEIARALKILPKQTREIIKLYFGIGVEYPLSAKAIGDKLSITPERVRQIIEKGITTLQESRLQKLYHGDIFNNLGNFVTNPWKSEEKANNNYNIVTNKHENFVEKKDRSKGPTIKKKLHQRGVPLGQAEIELIQQTMQEVGLTGIELYGVEHCLIKSNNMIARRMKDDKAFFDYMIDSTEKVRSHLLEKGIKTHYIVRVKTYEDQKTTTSDDLAVTLTSKQP